MKNLLLLPFLLLLASYSYSQNIRGKVFDTKTNEPLEGVHVYVKINKEGTFTDQKGRYYLKLKPGIDKNDLIHFSHVGFVLKSFTYNELKQNNFSVSLALGKINLDEINVVTSYKLKPLIGYNKLASMETGIHSFGSLIKNSKIYVIGGDATIEVDAFRKVISDDPEQSMYEVIRKSRALAMWEGQYYNDDLYVYDIKLDKWEKRDLKFRKRAHHNINISNEDNKAYILGGKRYSKNGRFIYLDDKIEIFDLKNNTIEIDKTNPHRAVDFESFMYNKNIIVMGGSIKEKKNGKKIYTNKVHIFDTESGLWYDLAKMPVAKETKGVLIDDKIYLFGGFNEKPLSAIESYDLETGKWNKEGELFNEISRPAITHKDNTIYLYDDGKIYTFDIKSKVLKEYLISLNFTSANLYLVNNKLYLLGGFRKDEFSVIPSSDLVSIDLNEFKFTRVRKSKVLN
ncbi:MAG: carboxypeptidase-like regulatory domain-containing protein [Aureibaculum sp.]|nr:carboxypeptidase-like regulatory domain-containing protein [Aureibaculum sp.]